MNKLKEYNDLLDEIIFLLENPIEQKSDKWLPYFKDKLNKKQYELSQINSNKRSQHR